MLPSKWFGICFSQASNKLLVKSNMYRMAHKLWFFDRLLHHIIHCGSMAFVACGKRARGMNVQQNVIMKWTKKYPVKNNTSPQSGTTRTNKLINFICRFWWAVISAALSRNGYIIADQICGVVPYRRWRASFVLFVILLESRSPMGKGFKKKRYFT